MCINPALVADYVPAGDGPQAEMTLSSWGPASKRAVLASELLIIIFWEVIAPLGEERRKLLPEDEDIDAGNLNEFDTKPLLSLSHVCRHWRDVALGLWTCIHGRCVDQMEAFLERSRPLTVTLALDVEHFGGNENGPMHKHGASAIKVHGTTPRMPHHHVGLLEKSMHRNRNLLASADQWSSLVFRAFAMIPVFNWLPSGSFPRLTHLLLFFDGLTALCHPFDILRLVSNTPELNFLHVDCLFNSVGFGDARQPPSNPIPLHYLRSLVFTQCWYDLVHAIISHLTLSEDVFIRLQSILDLDGHPARLPPLALRPVTALDIAIGNTDILMVADGQTSGLWISGYHDGAHAGWIPWVHGLPGSGCLTFAHVTHLHTNLDFGLYNDLEAFWNTFLAHLPRVTHLAVVLGLSSDPPNTYSAPTTVLSRALAPGGSDSGVAGVPCPALETLTVEWPDAMTVWELDSYQEFPRMLGARARVGHPIPHVVMQTMLARGFGESQTEDFVQELRRATEGHEAEYELLVKEEIGMGVCAYEMRDVLMGVVHR
ncbi:hypothetical protein V8D89_002453 [Ganoderma adspersum]